MAVGKYVHGDYANFLMYGLSTRPTNKHISKTLKYADEESVQKRFDKQIEEISNLFNTTKKKYSAQKISELEQNLNFFFGVQKGNISSNEVNNKGLSQETINYIYSMFEQQFASQLALSGATIDRNTMSVVQGNGSMQKYKQINDESVKAAIKDIENLNKRSVSSGIKTTDMDTLAKRLVALEKMRDALGCAGVNVSDFAQQIQKLREEYDDIESQLGITIAVNENKGQLNLKQFQGKQNVRIIKKEGQVKNFIEAIQSVYTDLRNAAAVNLSGKLAEYMVYVIQSVLNAGAQANVQKIVNEFLNGSANLGDKLVKRSTGSLLTSNSHLLLTDFIKDKTSKKILTGLNSTISDFALDKIKHREEIIIGNDKFLTSINPTKDKIDVIFEYQGQQNKTSIKNYDMSNMEHRNIHLLSGKSLSELVGPGNETFMYEFMNVAGVHNKSDASSLVQPSTLTLWKADEAMRLTALLRALAGGFLIKTDFGVANSKQVELLVINDNSQGEFKVYPIHEILDKIQNKIDLINMGDDYNRDKIGQWRGNAWYGSKVLSRKNARQRMTNMMAQLDAMQLNISIDKAIFREDFGY